MPEKEQDERLIGKIYHLSDEGYGFISSKEIPYTRIFFHWKGLEEDTKKFTELEKGMKIEFTPLEIVDDDDGKIRMRAIKIKVVD